MTKKQKNEAFDLAERVLYSKNPIERIIAEISPEIINFTNRDGRTLLMLSIRLNNIGLTQNIILRGAEVNLQDKLGWSALHFAAQFYLPDHAALLIEHGAKVDVQDIYGNSPLWRAVFESLGRGEVITLLLKNGADPHLKNNYGKSPLDLANTIANYDVKQFFNLTDNNGS